MTPRVPGRLGFGLRTEPVCSAVGLTINRRLAGGAIAESAPGRVGDFIIPILDPEGPDRDEFLRWAV